MFVQSSKFIEAHQGSINDISVYGQEFNSTTWKMCKMNLAIRGIEIDLGGHYADTFTNDLHKNLRADYIMANPPFNLEWQQARMANDPRWLYGLPPEANANYAWIQHMIYHLAPNGKAGIVLANGSLSTTSGGEGSIREEIIRAGLVEAIIVLPAQLFYTTPIPVCIWFITKNKQRKNETLFIDAREMGEMQTRKLKVLPQSDIDKIVNTVHNWQKNSENYKDIAGFCKSSTMEEIEENDYILTPGRYVGIKEVEEDSEPFEEKMERLTKELSKLFEKSNELEEEIKQNLKGIGFPIEQK